jgi:hypothetical protein
MLVEGGDGIGEGDSDSDADAEAEAEADADDEAEAEAEAEGDCDCEASGPTELNGAAEGTGVGLGVGLGLGVGQVDKLIDDWGTRAGSRVSIEGAPNSSTAPTRTRNPENKSNNRVVCAVWSRRRTDSFECLSAYTTATIAANTATPSSRNPAVTRASRPVSAELTIAGIDDPPSKLVSRVDPSAERLSSPSRGERYDTVGSTGN